MYKNANKMLLSKNNCPKNQNPMRHSITLSRIEQNLRKMKSMIHILHPPTFDDMLLFQNNDTDQEEGKCVCVCDCDGVRVICENKYYKKNYQESSKHSNLLTK